jgi:hypothetical protein
VSLLPRSELQLHVGGDAAVAHVVAPWPSRKVLATQRIAGGGVDALAALLAELRQSRRLPSRGRLVVDDSRLFYRIVAGGRSIREAQDAVRADFAKALGGAVLNVSVVLLPGGRWLAGAMPGDWLDACMRCAADHGVKITSVVPQLSVELAQIRPAVRDPRALLVLLRGQGSMLVRLLRGAPAAIAWERQGADTAEAYLARIDAFNQRCAIELEKSPQGASNTVQVFSPSAAPSVLLTQCQRLGWQVLSLAATPTAGGA